MAGNAQKFLQALTDFWTATVLSDDNITDIKQMRTY